MEKLKAPVPLTKRNLSPEKIIKLGRMVIKWLVEEKIKREADKLNDIKKES